MNRILILVVCFALSSCATLNIDDKDCDHSRLCEALKKSYNPKFPSCSFSIKPMTRQGRPLEGDPNLPSPSTSPSIEDSARNYLQSIDGVWVGEKCIN